MGKELNEDTSFKISIKTLIGIGFAMATIISMWFILQADIEEAKKLHIKRLSLETGAGIFFAPARKLFKNCGFKTCPPFAHYKEDVNSLYLTKLLNNS